MSAARYTQLQHGAHHLDDPTLGGRVSRHWLRTAHLQRRQAAAHHGRDQEVERGTTETQGCSQIRSRSARTCPPSGAFDQAQSRRSGRLRRPHPASGRAPAVPPTSPSRSSSVDVKLRAAPWWLRGIGPSAAAGPGDNKSQLQRWCSRVRPIVGNLFNEFYAIKRVGAAIGQTGDRDAGTVRAHQVFHPEPGTQLRTVQCNWPPVPADGWLHRRCRRVPFRPAP